MTDIKVRIPWANVTDPTAHALMTMVDNGDGTHSPKISAGNATANGGAPANADYIVKTANATLSAEIAIGSGTSGQVLTSDGTNPHWAAPAGGSTPTLAEVLAAGNDTGATAAITAANGLQLAGNSLNDGTAATVQVGSGASAASINGGQSDPDNGPYGAQVTAFAGGVSNPNSAVSGAGVEIYLSPAKAGGGGNGGDFVVDAAAGDGAGRRGLVFLNLPTSDPHVAGAAWANAGVVMVSAG